MSQFPLASFAGPRKPSEDTDQGSQFTSPRFTRMLKEAKVRISTDVKGRWMDNVFIERLWRSLKCECVDLQAFETGTQAREGIGDWIGFIARSARIRRSVD